MIGFFIRSFEVLSNLVNEPQLIATLRVRAAVAHRALHNRIRCYPTESRTKYVTQIVDWKVWYVGFDKSRSPRPFQRKALAIRSSACLHEQNDRNAKVRGCCAEDALFFIHGQHALRRPLPDCWAQELARSSAQEMRGGKRRTYRSQ
jgi:hypothetical protein